MTDQQPDGLTFSAPLAAGVGLVVASVIAAGSTAVGVSVSVSSFDAISLLAGLLAIGLLVWGLSAVTRGAYRRGVGTLSGAAGFVLVFLAPQSRSEPLFVGTGAIILALSGLFLIAEGFGYVLVAVDDTDGDTDQPGDEDDTEQSDDGTDSAAAE
ncbi:MAG: hypothetical protein ABEI98_02465 [Halorhabdus sp.]